MNIERLDRSQIKNPPKGLDSRKGVVGFAGHGDPGAFSFQNGPVQFRASKSSDVPAGLSVAG